MSSFAYIIGVTGDCQNTNSGIITASFQGGTPPYTISWDPPINVTQLLSTSASTSLITGLSASTYLFRVNDSTLPVNLQYIVNVPVSSGNCASILQIVPTSCGSNNGSVTVSTSANFSTTNFILKTFSGDTLQTIVSSLGQTTFEGLSAGTYYIEAVDYGGCTGTTETFIIDSSGSMDFGFYVVDDTQCNGPTGKIYVTGQTGNSPYTYQWSNGATGNTVTGLTQGTYSVNVTDSTGCSRIKQTSVGNVPIMGLGSIVVDAVPTCLGSDGALTLTIVGGAPPYYYSASTGDVEVTYSKSFQISNLPVGNYEFSVTDAAFCKFSISTNLNSPNSIASIDISSTQSTCGNEDGSITIIVAGGNAPFTYTLIYPDASEDSISVGASSYIFGNLGVGTYTVVVEDASGCFYSTERDIIGVDAFTISTSVTGTTCSAGNGILYVQKTSGGTAPFTYSLDNLVNITNTSLTAVTFNNVSAGQHQISVTDSLGCNETEQVFVPPSQPLTYNLFSTSCGSGSQGTITAFISSGTPPFTFQWSANVANNPQNITATGLSAGTYSVTISDSTGCNQTRETLIDCRKSYVSYQTFLMGEENFSVVSGTKKGLSQYLNEGFDILTENKNNCLLTEATFVVQVQLQPSGISVEQEFFSTNNLTSLIPENLYYDAIEFLLNNLPGIATVEIDPLTSEIKIISDPTEGTLNNQEVIIELIIVYDIMCSS